MNFDRHFARAVNAWNREDWHSVVRDTRAALDPTVINFRALQLNGLAHERLGQYDEAIESFTQSLRYHPNEGHLPLAQVRERKGDLRGALEGYLRERSIYPSYSVPRDGIIRVATALGDSARSNREWKAAVKFYREALLHDDEDASLQNRLGESALMSGLTEVAAVAFGKAIALAPEIARHHNNAGAAFAKIGRTPDARSAYLEAIALDPAYARPHRNLADLLLSAGDSSGAVREYRKFIELWKGDATFIEQARILDGQIEKTEHE